MEWMMNVWLVGLLIIATMWNLAVVLKLYGLVKKVCNGGKKKQDDSGSD